MFRRMMKNKESAPVDKQIQRENQQQRLPRSWPSPDHHKCSRILCNYPNPPQSVSGTYQCSGCYKGTYVVSMSQAAKIHDEVHRAFKWHDERRKEGQKKRRDAERIHEERYIARYLADDEEMWKRAMKLKWQEEEERRKIEEEKRLAILRAEEKKRQEAIQVEERKRQESLQAEAMRRQAAAKNVEVKWRNGREGRRDGVVNTAQAHMCAGNEAKVAKVERRATIKSTIVQVETFDIDSLSSVSMYSQPSYISRGSKPLMSAPVPPVPTLTRSQQRRPLTPDSSHTISSQESYNRPRVARPDLWAPEPSFRSRTPAAPPRSPKRQGDRNTSTTTASQISAMNFYASQSAAKYPSFPRGGVPPVPTKPKIARHY